MVGCAMFTQKPSLLSMLSDADNSCTASQPPQCHSIRLSYSNVDEPSEPPLHTCQSSNDEKNFHEKYGRLGAINLSLIQL